MTDPFAALGLPARPDLTGDDIRAAWRRMAAATHPDRTDGGDPARYAEAAAAYTTLRTDSGRGEAYADLTGGRRGPDGRLRRGRPAVLALRTAVAAAVSAGALAVAGPQPASFALVAGALTWLARTGRRELAPPARPVTRSWFAPGRSRAARPSGTGGAGR
jgi:curved DNA-binding protein CbpA